MPDVTMEKPAAWLSRRPDHVKALSWSDIDRVCLITCGRLQRLPIHGDYFKRSAVNMHRVNERVVRADEADFQCLADSPRARVLRRMREAVDRADVRLVVM